MQNLKNTEVLYRGIDWLRIGYYVEALNLEDYNTFIDNLRDFLNLPFDQQYYELPPTEKNLSPYKLRIKTTANIYPYVIMLVWEEFNISIRLGHSLKPYQIENLYKGYTPTPNILIEIPGKALRPTTIPLTKFFLKSFFQLIDQIGGIIHGLTFSRIDYALDLTNQKEAINLILSFETARKIKIYGENESLTLKKSVKNLKEQINQIIEQQNIKHIGIGSPETRLAVYYLKSDADTHLKSIYEFCGFPYGEKINGKTIYPHRVEVRFNAKHFKENRKIYTLERVKPWDLDTLIELAFEEIKPYLPESFNKYIYAPHPLIIKEVQTIPTDREKSIQKLVKKQELKDKALRLLTLFITSLKEDIQPVDIINLAYRLTKKGDQKVMEKLERHEVDKKKLLKAFKKICPTIEI